MIATDFKPSDLRRYDPETGDGLHSDVEWKSILSEETYAKTQRKIEEKFSNVDSDSIKFMRRHAKTDLYAFATGILGYNRLKAKPHLHLCSWMERNADWQFREILLPRGHFKSTICTLADSIQIVLPDDAGDQPWPRNLGTDCRLLICHETDGQASNFLFAITNQILQNPMIGGLFPEIIPSPRKHRINRSELELPREGFWPEATIGTMGVGGRSQGRHYNYIKFDDLVGDKARDSAMLMESAKEWFDNIQSFFSKFSEDHFDLIGTRWGFDDLYSHVHDRYYLDETKESLLLKYIRGVEEPDHLGVLRAIFPDEFPLEKLAILRKNKKVFSAQYANNPDESATEFDKGWKRFYHWAGFNTIVVFSGKTQTRINVRDLDICILIDPAVSGLGGVVVTGTDKLNRIFVLEALKEEWKPPQLCDLTFRLVARWQPRLVAIENVLFSVIFQNWFESEMRHRGTYFNIVPVEPKEGGRNLSKEHRVRQLSNYFSAGLIFFSAGQDNQGKNQNDIIKEFDSFGATRNYHMLDALAYGPDVWMPGLSRAKVNQYAQDEAALLAQRDIETGYSNIELVSGY